MVSEEVLILACFLYSEYCFLVGGVSYSGEPLPTWEELYNDDSKIKQSSAWMNTADSLLSRAEGKWCEDTQSAVFKIDINKLKKN